MLILRLFLIGALGSLAFGVRAAEVGSTPAPVVVELFTSEGCSACPPADALFNRMSADPSIVRISWHVDYWNDLGWKDTQSKPEFTARQKAYQDRLKIRFVYTPQMVVNGQYETVASKEHKVSAVLQEGRASGLPVHLSYEQTASGVEVKIGHGSAPKPADVWLVNLASHRQVEIGGGENHGRRLIYTNVARDVRKLGTWNGHAQTLMLSNAQVAGTDGDGCAILLQEANAGPILGAVAIQQPKVGE